ncbi:hypothetical protein [Euzebya pacifica]|uniref:hypothetical protein n=1 Tax=Euzebya pacifica TaxID=1608957 RepID=UPI000DF85D00|nr:hypothetical protein [Euzebya pacifica]
MVFIVVTGADTVGRGRVRNWYATATAIADASGDGGEAAAGDGGVGGRGQVAAGPPLARAGRRVVLTGVSGRPDG